MKQVYKRSVQAIFTIWAVLTISFFMIRLLPGGPIAYLKGRFARMGMDPSAAETLASSYTNINPDKSLPLQYVEYVIAFAQGDMGTSVFYQEPVAKMIAEALPWTLLVMSIAMTLTFGLAILLGAVMAYRQGSRFDSITSVASTVLASAPYYVAAIGLLYFIAYQWSLLPTSGRVGLTVEVGFTLEFVISALRHAILPIFSIVITGVGAQALSMRGNSVSILGDDFLQVARLRGLSERRISVNYVARNAVLPMYTGFMISIGYVFGGSIILERIFQYQGIGFYMFQSISARDYPLMLGCFTVITVGVVGGILIADLTYSKIDPRISSRQGGGEKGKSRSIRKQIKNLVSRFRSIRQPDYSRENASTTDPDTNQIFGIDLTEVEAEDITLNQRIEKVGVTARIIWGDWRAKFGLFVLTLFVLVGLVGVRTLEAPSANQAPLLVPPFQNMAYPLGTDGLGQNLLSKTIYAIPPMLKMIISGAVFATGMATVVGTFAGYIGGYTDRVLMTITDMMMAIPGLPLMIVFAAIFEPTNPYVIGPLLTINVWAGLARTIRSEVLSLREAEYVESASTMGIGTSRIIYKDILPNLMSYISINFAHNARIVVFNSVGLYFLGALPYSTENWGVMMNQAYQNGALYTWESAHWLLVPMSVIILFTLALVLLSQGIDRVFNPQIRTKYSDEEDEPVTEETSASRTSAGNI